MIKKQIIAIIILMFLIIGDVWADCDNDLFNKINNSISLFFASSNPAYEEYIDEVTLDSEKTIGNNYLSGAAIEGRKKFGKVVASIYGDFFTGNLRYSGATWDGEPLTFDASHNTYDVNLGLEIPYFPNRNFVITLPVAKVGYHRWDRATDANTRPGDYEEVYSNWFLAGGVGMGYNILDRVYLSGNVLLGLTLDAQMVADPMPPMIITSQTFDLDSKPYYEGNLQADISLTQRLFASLFLKYTQFEYGKSHGNDYYIYEPDSRTKDLKFGIGIKYSFN